MSKIVLLLILFFISFSNPCFGSVKEDILCLAKNIYFEANNQSYLGQQAVAFVTLNRVKSDLYPNNICDVVWQPKQFSWTIDGKLNTPRNMRKFSIAIAAAAYVYSNYGYIKDPTEGAIMYHTVYVRPWWHDYYTPTVIIGDHIFLK